jgi:hypothetical protein
MVMLLKKRAPQTYSFIRESAPNGLRSVINEKLTEGLGDRDNAKEIFTTIFQGQ